MSRVLFVTWDGPQVSYLEGLFLPIFAGLRQHGHEFAVLQFTWGNREKSDRVGSACKAAGMPYRRIEIWRAGAAGAFLTSCLGGKHVDAAVREWRIDTLMPRSLLPALATLRSKSGKRLPIVFDADGLPADERVDFAGLGQRSLVYRVLRWVEATAVRRARAVLVRTAATVPILVERGGRSVTASKFHVVTNGRDPERFLSAKAPQPRSAGPRLCYLGSIGPQYLPGSMFDLAAQVRSNFPDATFSVFTRERETAAAALTAAGLEDQQWISIETLEPIDVPQALIGCDVGFALRQPKLSMQGVAPIKIGDYLLSGVPIIGTKGIGPVAEAIHSGCMFAADRPIEEINRWVAEVLADRGGFRDRCRKIGVAEFSLERSIGQYQVVLDAIQHGSPGSAA